MSHAKTDKEFAKLSAYDALRDAYRKDWSSTDATRLREILKRDRDQERNQLPKEKSLKV